MNIFRTFELFWRLPAKLFSKKKLVVTHVETTDAETKTPTDVQISTDEIFLTVYNNRKVYNLLSAVLYKKKFSDENNNRKIFNQRSLY